VLVTHWVLLTRLVLVTVGPTYMTGMVTHWVLLTRLVLVTHWVPLTRDWYDNTLGPNYKIGVLTHWVPVSRLKLVTLGHTRLLLVTHWVPLTTLGHSWFSSAPPAKCYCSASHRAVTASFHILSRS
jgi:hypothetical protein